MKPFKSPGIFTFFFKKKPAFWWTPQSNPADTAVSINKPATSGIALVIVLGMLVLVAVLVIAFLSSVSTELQSSKSYASGSDARALADSAVNIVISQIQDATAASGTSATTGNPYVLAWASQPGMIRTYGDDGNPVTAYKLYSSGTLRVSGSYNPVSNLSTEIPDDWAGAAKTNLYTDLNKPVTAGSGTTALTHYPIIDPAAIAPSQSGTNTTLSGSSTPIEGCFINTTTGIITTGSAQTNPIPLPVQWLYVLKDGSVQPMNPNSGIVTGAGTKMADGSTNTIVGRVAFWTDDETCKVNVNTASEGTFWDRPWVSGSTGSYEASFTQYLPAQNEFQRYPGHPAMTCLSTIFPPLNGETQTAYNARIYGIIPKVSDGGSKSASVAISGTSPAIVADNERLFTSVDEFLFSGTSIVSGTRQANPIVSGSNFTQNDIEKTRFFLTANSRAPEVNLFNKPRVTLWPLQIDPDPGTGKHTQTSKDKLIAFCSTIGSGVNAKPYYFQRYDTFDYSASGPNNRTVTGTYSPTQNPMPSSQSTTMDWNLIQRNQDLYAYLQSLTGSPIPGLGGSFLGKYPDSRNQILTEMFDFLRSNINITTTGIVTAGGTSGYSYAPFNASGGSWTGQFNVVPLVLPNGTKGFGAQLPTITQAAMIFYRENSWTVSGTVPPNGIMVVDGTSTTYSSGTVLSNYPLGITTTITGSNYAVSDSGIKVGAFLVLQPFTPTPGPPPWNANLRIAVGHLNDFTVGGINMGFPDEANAVNLVTARDGECNSTALTGLELFTQYWSLKIKQTGTTAVGSPTEEQFYPFVSGTVTLSGSTFDFNGGPITVKIYSGYATSLNPDDLIQTINMRFPPATGLPVPQATGSATTSVTSGTITIATDPYTDVRNHFGALQSNGVGIQQDFAHNPLPLIRPLDTVRSVEPRYGGPAKGDFRLIAGLRNVPEEFFEGHGMTNGEPPLDGKKYSDVATTSRLIHSLHVDADSGPNASGAANGYYTGSGTDHGKLLQVASYQKGSPKGNREPIAPRGMTQATMSNGSLGDWDTGIGRQRDGPYINKPDLGNVGSGAGSTGGYYLSGGYDRSSNDVVVIDIGASYAPNRQIASAVAFGSLPTGINTTTGTNSRPWQTLLFCKNPLSGTAHPGFGTSLNAGGGPPYTTPPDHAFLDLFTMPIVEPYAISEPFSTAGKVNMNYQIVPFTYLTRDTGVRAVLKSTRVMAIPTTAGTLYKENQTTVTMPDCRYTISPDELNGTLAGFESRFTLGDIFRSASEICDIYLVPQYLANTTTPAPASPTYSTMAAWWLGASAASSNGYKLTGDNVREQPYGHIYPRLTTKSNTYTVHVQTQALKKSINTPANKFIEGKDQVMGEFRGSFIVERYLDPNSDTLVHVGGKTPATETDSDAMVGPYKFRILSSKRFAP